MVRYINKEEYRVSNWSGGKTREIMILPDGADYGKREFGLRISSATVELEESDFTNLPGVHRFITLLSGKMNLTINGKNIEVLPKQIVEFEGEDIVHCVGKATDFNLMLKGMNGEMVLLKKEERRIVKKESILAFADKETKIVIDGKEYLIKENDSILCKDVEEIISLDRDVIAIVIQEN